MPDIAIANHHFCHEEEKALAELLTSYLILDATPKTSPALWQDVEIYIRYCKRDVWSLDADHRANAHRALRVYRLKYIVEHFTKPEILEILNDFFAHSDEIILLDALKKRLHAPIDDLILIQEKRVVTKPEISKSAKELDKLFKYPAWLEFDDEANDYIFGQILHDKLSDEQIDYFLGAADTMKDYDKWFKVAKHVLTTTKNAHAFWTAGDVLSIVWKAVPEDQNSQKWFKDEIFNIFWPRVQSVWPILNKDKIDFEEDNAAKILGDSIGWLEVLDDLKERLPELGKDYEPTTHQTDAEDFAHAEGFLLGRLESEDSAISELMDLLFSLSDLVYDDNSLERFETLATQKFLPATERFKNRIDLKEAESWIKRSVNHAKDYIATLKRERNHLAKRLIKA